jgi:hypothetical protein
MTCRLGVVLFLQAKKQLEVFDSAEHEDDNGTGGADYEHAFKNPHQHRDEQIHKLTMLFETREVDQFENQLWLLAVGFGFSTMV